MRTVKQIDEKIHRVPTYLFTLQCQYQQNIKSLIPSLSIPKFLNWLDLYILFKKPILLTCQFVEVRSFI